MMLIMSNAFHRGQVIRSYKIKRSVPKLTTSKTLAVISSDTVANSCPSALAETAVTGRRWARYTFTNSMPTSCFFQSFKTPSTDVVIKNSVLINAIWSVFWSSRIANSVLCHDGKVNSISVHEGLVVLVCLRDMFEV